MNKYLMAVAVTCGAVAAPVAAQDKLYTEVDAAVTRTLAPKLKAAGAAKVSLDWVVNENGTKVIGSAGISQALEECLAKHGIAVVAGQGTRIIVTVTPIPKDAKCELPATKLTIRLTVNMQDVCEVVRLVFGADSIAVIESLSKFPPPNATPAQVTQVINDARKNPAPVPPPRGARVTKFYTADKALFVEFLVAPAGLENPKDADFVPRALDAKGRVPVAPGERYRLRVTSQVSHSICISPTIGGLDWSALYTDPDGQKQRLFVEVPANGTTTVRGFARTVKDSHSFDVSRLPTDAAGRQAETGVVVVRYAACWKQGETAPAGEPKVENALSGVETKPGAVVPDEKVIVQRMVGNTRDLVRIIYGEFKD